MQQFFADVPVGAVGQIGQNESNEVVVLFGPTPHDFVHPRQAANGFLSDDVFAVSQLFHDDGNVLAQGLVAHAPRFFGLALDELFVAVLLLVHLNYHINYVERV